MGDLISRQAVLKLLSTIPPEEAMTKAMLIQSVKQMDSETVTECNNLISRQSAIDALDTGLWGVEWDKALATAILKDLPSAEPEPIKVSVDREMTEEELKELKKKIADSPVVLLPSAQPEIIHCCDCIYYDPEHIEKNGVRYEYEDMPKDAFDILGTGLVNSEYGINVGGMCCRDYNVVYSEDKRVFVSKQNYCGRAERRTDE